MWERIKDAGNKELLGNSHELRRMEETSERGQDCVQVIVPMMVMVVVVMINITCCTFNTSPHKKISHLRSNKFGEKTSFFYPFNTCSASKS
jgi:hypothetical protein